MFQSEFSNEGSSKIVRWSDLDISMKINPNTRDFQIRKNEDAVKQHIKLLFLDDGILFKPETDSGIDLQLFEAWNSASKYFLENRVRSHLQRYEPRINVKSVLANFDYGSRRLDLNLDYEIDQESQNIDFKFLIRAVN